MVLGGFALHWLLRRWVERGADVGAGADTGAWAARAWAKHCWIRVVMSGAGGDNGWDEPKSICCSVASENWFVFECYVDVLVPEEVHLGGGEDCCAVGVTGLANG